MITSSNSVRILENVVIDSTTKITINEKKQKNIKSSFLMLKLKKLIMKKKVKKRCAQ